MLQYQKTYDSSERADIRNKLVAAVNQQFDDRQAAREEELKQLEEQVRRLRELQQRRKSAKQDIVQNRIDQLFREAEGLGWAAPTQSARGNDFTIQTPLAIPRPTIKNPFKH